MFGKSRSELQESLGAIQSKLERIDAALVVRDPGNARSVEVFEGLRRSIVSAARSRRQHLSQLITLTEALEKGATVETLSELADQWRMEAGLRRWDDPSAPAFFEILDGEGPELEVEAPAWVDIGAGDEVLLVKPGLARRVAASPAAEGQDTDEEEAVEPPGQVASTVSESHGTEATSDELTEATADPAIVGDGAAGGGPAAGAETSVQSDVATAEGQREGQDR